MFNKICERCETPYLAKRRASRFCSRSCAIKDAHKSGTYDHCQQLRRTGIKNPCKNCGKEMYVKAYEADRKRFCSVNCKIEYEAKEKSVTKPCEVCGNSFEVGRFRHARAKYCSKACYYKAMAKVGSVIVNCVVCGKEHRRPPSHLKYEPTCSMECRSIKQKTRCLKPADTDNQIIKWYRRRGLIKECQRCSYMEHPEILIIHHRDRNRRNNNLENHEILCPNCHAMEHYSENKTGWIHQSQSRKSTKRRKEAA